MNKQLIIERTLKVINQLPEDKAEEISDFADFVFKKYEEQELSKGIQKLAAESNSFNFLESEEELYYRFRFKSCVHFSAKISHQIRPFDPYSNFFTPFS
jgi:hypothetical protein